MKRLILIAALFAVSGCATLSKEEIANCKGDELCINRLLEDKEHEREDKRIVQYEKALARYIDLKSKCDVAIRCDPMSKACGRSITKGRLSIYELTSARCIGHVIW